MADTFRVQAPATLAHLGPGLGVLGLALDLWAELEVELDPASTGADSGDDDDSPIRIERVAEDGSPILPRHLDSRHDALLRGMQHATEALGGKLPTALGLTLTTAFPHGMGLGSSTAEYALGIAAAYELAARAGIKRNEPGAGKEEQALILRMSRDLEVLVGLGGDPAHGAAAIAGGLAAAVPLLPGDFTGDESSAKRRKVGEDRAHYLPQQLTGSRRGFRLLRLALDDGWYCSLAIPEVRHGTADVHRILPPTVSNIVTQRTVGRFAGLLHALATGDLDLLRAGMHDEVHVPYRKKLVAGLDNALRAAIDAGAAASTIAGHGPSLVAWSRDEGTGVAAAEAMQDAFTAAGVEAGTIVSQPFVSDRGAAGLVDEVDDDNEPDESAPPSSNGDGEEE